MGPPLPSSRHLPSTRPPNPSTRHRAPTNPRRARERTTPAAATWPPAAVTPAASPAAAAEAPAAATSPDVAASRTPDDGLPVSSELAGEVPRLSGSPWTQTLTTSTSGHVDDLQQAQQQHQTQNQQQRQHRHIRSREGPPQRPAVVSGRRQVLLGGAGALLGTAAAPPSSAVGAPSAAPAAAATTAAAAAAAAGTTCAPAPTAAGAAPRGWQALRDPSINRGLATPVAERQLYGLEGLLPARVTAPQVEVARAAAAVQRAAAGGTSTSSLLSYNTLMALREADQATFFALVQQDVERYLPLIYTPTVGDACLAWGSLLPRPTGLVISLDDAGRVQRLVDNWAAAQPQARIAVITDGERILGLGDLGAHGLGIPVGKAAVYGAAGVAPGWVVPVALDVGCNTDRVVNDPLYVGLRRPRERGAAYYQLVDEVVAALQARYGSELLVHWEDVGAAQAFPLLERLESRGVPTFNDDIQATAAVTVAALLGAERLEGVPPLERQTFLFFGAGQANLGVAQLLCAELVGRGMDRAEAADRIWLVDRQGLVTRDRPDLSAGKAQFAKQRPAGLNGSSDLADLVAALRPNALIGAATVGGAFGPRVLAALTQAQPSRSSRPLVFALSNPTSRAECSFQQAFEGTDGRAVFASGTQFPLLTSVGRTLRPAQANNCLVFPGLGAGCVASGAARVTEGMLLAAARAVADLTSPEDLAADCVLPPVGLLGRCALHVAVAVSRAAATEMVATSGSAAGGKATCVGPLLLPGARRGRGGRRPGLGCRWPAPGAGRNRRRRALEAAGAVPATGPGGLGMIRW